MTSRHLTVLLTLCAALPAGAAPVFETENIFPPQAKHCHGSSIVALPNGDFLACWFHGSGERTATDVVVRGARLKKGAKAWSEPFLMADTPGLADCNPVLFLDEKDRLWLFWIPVLAGRWECCQLKYRRAEDYLDDGPPKWNWQDVIILKPGEAFPDQIAAAFKAVGPDDVIWGEYALPYEEMIVEAAKDPYKRQTGWMTRIHPIRLPSGRILLPLYSDGFNVSLVAISDDCGESWQPSAPIAPMGPIQPTLVRKNDGTIVAYCRDSGGPPPRVQHSVSKDEGLTWSPCVDTDIPNPGSSLEAIRLAEGTWFMVLNDTEDGRHRLSAWLSTDEGATWKWKKAIEPSGDGGTSFGYPSAIQTPDGLIHLTYTYQCKEGKTIRHTMLNTEWVKE